MRHPDFRPAAWRRWLAAAALATTAFAALPALADPPGRVGRLSWLAGQVTLRSGTDGSQSAAQRNWPLSTNDALSTSPSGRAEVWIGSGALRLDVGTDLTVAALDDQQLRFNLQRGSMALRVAVLDANDGDSIDTPAGRVTVTAPGELRVDAQGNHVTVTAWNGAARVDAPSGSMTVRPGQRVDFDTAAGTSSLAQPAQDDFRAFVAQRDGAFDGRASTRYVSPETTGIEDLDSYGQWTTTPDYGAVWVPTVAATWAPYRYGHWASVGAWGWTWIDDAPWGFAPFHYGRWAEWQGRWCWVPGRFVAHPVYAPALVGWVGAPGVGVSVSIGASVGASVGWFPLAPREVYVPPYSVSPTYVRNINVTHVTNVTNITNVNVTNVHYTYQHDTRALTVVQNNVMTSRQPVATHMVAMNDARMHAYAANNTVAAQPPVAPPSAHFVPAAHTADEHAPPLAGSVHAATAPPPAAMHPQQQAEQLRPPHVAALHPQPTAVPHPPAEAAAADARAREQAAERNREQAEAQQRQAAYSAEAHARAQQPQAEMRQRQIEQQQAQRERAQAMRGERPHPEHERPREEHEPGNRE